MIERLKTRYTVIIVTHDMRRAARVSDDTALVRVGEPIEFDAADRIATSLASTLTEDDITVRFG